MKEPTGVTKDTSTLIDYFYTTNRNLIISSGVTAITISDHYLIYGIRKFKTLKQAPKFIEHRDFKHFNEQNFLWNLTSLSTLNLIHSDPNKSWISLKNNFFEIVNTHAPLKRRKVSNKQIPWLTNDLLLKKREKIYLKRKAVLSKSMTDWSAYRIARNCYNELVKNTICSYYQNKLHNNQGDLKKTWKTINELTNNSKKQSTIPEIKIHSVEIADPITNAFNKHFVGPRDENIPEYEWGWRSVFIMIKHHGQAALLHTYITNSISADLADCCTLAPHPTSLLDHGSIPVPWDLFT